MRLSRHTTAVAYGPVVPSVDGIRTLGGMIFGTKTRSVLRRNQHHTDSWDPKYAPVSVEGYPAPLIGTVGFCEWLRNLYQTTRCHIREE
jgi:hypothetical protein